MENSKKKFTEWLKNVPKWPLRYNRGEVHPLTDNWEEQFKKAGREQEWINTGKWPTEEEKAKMYPDEVNKPVQTIEEWGKLSIEEKVQSTQRTIDSMRNNPEQWEDRISAVVYTTEEQREVLRKIQSEYGSKVIKNEQSGKEQSLEDKMKILKRIKTIQPNPIYGSSAGPTALTTDDRTLEIGIKIAEDYLEKIYKGELYKQNSSDPMRTIIRDMQQLLSKLPVEIQVEIATRILDKAVIDKEQKTWEQEASEEYLEQMSTKVGNTLGRSQGAMYMQVTPDSQMYTTLEMIKESLRILKIGHEVKPVPEEGIHINWPPISIEYMIRGLENTIKAGYQLKQQDNGTEE